MPFPGVFRGIKGDLRLMSGGELSWLGAHKKPRPARPPAIQFNFLASDYDFQALIYGARLSRKIAAQPALKPFVSEEVLPGPGVQTDEQMIEEIRVRGVSNLHPVGTCRMAREAEAVVDPQLRVHGVERLRVADASITPQVPGAAATPTPPRSRPAQPDVNALDKYLRNPGAPRGFWPSSPDIARAMLERYNGKNGERKP
jgi:choline dehydrogenase-like flavoprotein